MSSTTFSLKTKVVPFFVGSPVVNGFPIGSEVKSPQRTGILYCLAIWKLCTIIHALSIIIMFNRAREFEDKFQRGQLYLE